MTEHLRRRTLTSLLMLFPIVLSAQAPAPTPAPPLPTPGAHARQIGGYKQESIEIQLGPKEGMEYKYRMEKGAGLLYSWTSSARVNYDFHSEPAAGPRGYAETFDKADGTMQAQGAYTAPFPGIHGWYWENPTPEPVTIKLTAAGFFNESLEFRKGASVKTKEFK